MGRPLKQIDEKRLLSLRGEGKNLKEISKKMGVSIPTLSRRLAVLNHRGLFTKYRELQGLQLTELQARILSAVGIDQIEKASLVEIANAYLILKKAELAIKGKESCTIQGLLAHLQKLENRGE